MLTKVLLTLFPLVFAHLSRMAGGAFPKLPLGLDQHLYALPYGLLGGFIGTSLGIPFGVALGFLSYTTAFLGKRTGHGHYFNLAYTPDYGKPEKMETILTPIFGPDTHTNYWRDFTGLALTGILVVLGLCVTLVLTGFYLAAIVMFTSGFLKAVAYAIGWKLVPLHKQKPGKYLGEATAVGEFLTGLFGGIGLVLVCLLVY